jgi:hypothetical protein
VPVIFLQPSAAPSCASSDATAAAPAVAAVQARRRPQLRGFLLTLSGGGLPVSDSHPEAVARFIAAAASAAEAPPISIHCTSRLFLRGMIAPELSDRI